MKRFLERQAIFNATLKVFAVFSKRRGFNRLTKALTTATAKLNLLLNKPKQVKDVQELAETWKALMPPDGQDNFRIASTDGETAYVEIHLHCPLRGSGKPEACYQLMNYDRQLMRKVGGELVVLESQSNSGKNHCKLAIRKIGSDTSDLVPAHLREQSSTGA